MVWNVYSRMLLLYRAFETGHDVGRGFSDWKFNLRNLEHGVSKHPCFPTLNLTTCWVLCIFCGCVPNGSLNHHYGGRRGIWRPGLCMLAQLRLHMQTNYSVLYKLVKLSKDGEHPLGDFQMPDIGEDAIFKLSVAWMFLMQLVLCEVPLRIRSLEETLTELGFPASRWQSAHQGLQDAQLAKPAAA